MWIWNVNSEPFIWFDEQMITELPHISELENRFQMYSIKVLKVTLCFEQNDQELGRCWFCFYLFQRSMDTSVYILANRKDSFKFISRAILKISHGALFREQCTWTSISFIFHFVSSLSQETVWDFAFLLTTHYRNTSLNPK